MALNVSVPLHRYSPDAISDAVSRVLSSEAFANSKRLQRFLSYVVDRSLAGQPADLKEYNLALAVFDREPSFDPRMDSIVRVEARRLRQQLEGYYRNAGRNDPLMIVLPKGSYVPVFEPIAAPPQKQTAAARPSKRQWLALAAVGIALAGGVLLWKSGVLPGTRVPHHWRIENSKLIVLDSADRICWEKPFPAQAPDSNYHVVDRVLIADIDEDGEAEVLVNSRPADIASRGGNLSCYDRRGVLRWEFHFGRRMTFGDRTFDASYGGRFVRLLKTGGRSFVLTIANHYLWYPAQAALLDPKTGRLIEEYWHPGSIYHMAAEDIDGDGGEELLLGAINNPGEGLGHAALAVLKIPFSNTAPRQSVQKDEFPALTGGGEVAYRMFPLPDVCRVMGKLPIMTRMHIDQNHRIVVQTPLVEDGGIVYYLGPDLNVLEYRFSDNFAALHERYYRQRLLDHRLSPQESESLGKVVAFDAAPNGNSPDLRRFWQ